MKKSDFRQAAVEIRYQVLKQDAENGTPIYEV